MLKAGSFIMGRTKKSKNGKKSGKSPTDEMRKNLEGRKVLLTRNRTRAKPAQKPKPRPTRPTAKSTTTKVGKPGFNRRTVKAGTKAKSTGARKTAAASRRRRAGRLSGGGVARGMGAATKGGKFTRNG